MEAHKQHKENVSLWGAVAIGVGGMVGGGIFAVLGLAVMLSGGATPLSFAIAGIIALLTAYSYAKLSVAYPSRGGTVIFLDKAFGVDLLTGGLNNLLWVSYIVTLSLYAAAFANYAGTFLSSSGSLWTHGLISAAIIIPTVLNMTSASLISKTETYVVFLKVAILLAVIAFGFSDLDFSRLAPGTWGSFTSIVGGGMMIFVAYEGFELIANTAPDIVDYKKTLPRAYYISVGFVLALYVLIAMVTVGALSSEQIAKASDFALAEAAKPSLGNWGFHLVAVSAVLATFSAINATLYGSARLSYTIADENELPAFLEKKIWNQPIAGLLLTAALALIMANSVDLSNISTMGSAGFLILFAAVNAANFKQAKTIQSSRTVAALGFLGCAFALGSLMWHSLQESPTQLLFLGAMVGFSFGVEGLFMRFGKRTKDESA
jgi:amino acid transporter